MTTHWIGPIQNDSAIVSLALSADDQLLACGGSDSTVSVWNPADGRLLWRLQGLRHQVHAVAFSANASLLAAVNLWGGLCVWTLADGRLLAQKPDGTGRRMRSLVYPTTSLQADLPQQLSESMHSQTERVLARNGKTLAVRHGAFSLQIEAYKTRKSLGTLALDQYELTATGARAMTWSSDSQSLALAGVRWAGIFQPFKEPALFHAVTLPTSDETTPIAVTSGALRLLHAQGNVVTMLDVPDEPVLTRWKTLQRQAEGPESEIQVQAERDWTWGATTEGYEGVHTYEGQLVWYSHSHNPHSGGAAREQSFVDFLKDGPAVAMASVPEHILAQVYQAVRKLV